MIDLTQIDSLKESHNLEAKSAQEGLPKSIWESISAFANTTGGVILLGIDEDKDGNLKIIGLKNARKMLDDFWNSANSPDKLQPCILSDNDVYTQHFNDKDVIIIEVPRTERHLRPVYINGNPLTGTYRRKFTGDYKCSTPEVSAMLRDATDEPLDIDIVPNCRIEDLDTTSITAYRTTYNLKREGNIWTQLDIPDFLCRIGAAAPDTNGTIRPTRAGLLMFGQEWLITRTYPNYFIDYREVMDDSVRWEDRLTSQDGRWSGNVYDAFYRIYNKITPALKAPFKTDGLYRQNETPAHEAIREALVNTFTNADYSVEGGVKITHSTNALIFENPGGFRVGIEDALTGGISNPRNKTLMKMFSLIDLSERAGSGIPNMVANWKESGYAAPELSESVDPERSIVLLPLAPSENKSNKTYKTSSQKSNKSYEDAALDLILQNGCVTTKMLADYTGVTTVTARKTLKRLADAGRLHWVGNSKSDPSQHYVL